MEATKTPQEKDGEVYANESDDTVATELDTEDQGTLRGKTFRQLYRK